MAIIRKKFFENIKNNKLFASLSQKQIDGFNSILDFCDSKPDEYKDLRWLAYILATVKHECANTMQPIEEYGKGKGKPYGTKQKRTGVKYTNPNKVYFGRGFVQLTWYENYETMGRLLGVDLLNQPELALDLVIATKILFEGMTKGNSNFGDFTGRCLEQYFNKTTEDWEGARKIINGKDKAKLIAGYAQLFYKSLK